MICWASFKYIALVFNFHILFLGIESMDVFLRFTQFIQKTFALWVIVFAVLALWQPEFFVWLKAYIPWILGIIMLVIIFLIGHVINIAISSLGAYVHTSRLQYVEYFSKFYEGCGRKFSPLAKD